MDLLRFNGQIIEYEMYKSNRAKRLCFSVHDFKLRVAVPKSVTYEDARKYIEENSDLLAKKLNLLKGFHSSYQFVTGEKLFYRGRFYPLKIVYADLINGYAAFKGSQIYVFLPECIPSENKPNSIRAVLREWYVNQAEKILPDMVDYYSKVMGLSYGKVKIKDQKTRWGSCSSKGNLNFNWRIIMAPNQVVAYVIIHELSHLRSMNHSGTFWKEVRNYMPEYERWRLWLRDYGQLLMKI
ncbi:protein of unknown function DUF45 [Syntrophobotulus glycolicus DSM 8271]|uniref:YgjP-like metallopeptidase domain-containing protein n=1 Tax=Syntrophobotulus glycolicus (strain DSM 8271 / FlGlyR) TaxID=645991 RepID=F0SW61_SYNGF|nr:SprT family zinc-dependent metalloprotease [Syntrophobotulus glycolicus]ADY54547.1 protein of unknown function DUF45 [Syntrophobotulus glycolicus DSM 8271]